MKVDYFNCLMTQFLQANGYSNFNKFSGDLNDEFEQWLLEMEKNKSTYRDIIEYLHFNYNSSDCAEIGKGITDTVIKPGEATYVISPYIHTFNFIDYKLMDEKLLENVDYFLTSYATHNPYVLSDIAKYRRFVNNGYEICVGVFGNVSDKDKKNKIREIQLLKAALLLDGYDDKIKEVNSTIYDQYFDVISVSHSYEKKLSKYK